MVAVTASSCPAEVASIYGGLEEKDQELKWLEKAYQIHDGGLFLFNAHVSRLGPHPDPRYVDLVRRIESASSNSKLKGKSR